MDDLDRLYFQFVEILRRERPSAVTGQMTVLELHDQLIPYRRVRDPAGLRSNDDYETALSRLLSGERGYLLGDPPVQEELRAGLDEKLPDIRRYRAFPEARVRLNPDLIPPPGHIRYAPPELRQRADWPDAVGEPEKPEADGGAPGMRVEELGPDGREVDEADSAAAMSAEVCPVCEAGVPVDSVFCPFCGARLAPGTCRVCGASLDPVWLFCSTCGTPRQDRPGEPS